VKRFFMFLVGSVLFLGSPISSSAQQGQDEWLVGKWQGVLQDFADPSLNAGRTLRVTAVSQDGGVQGFWYISGREQYPAKITIEGSTIGVVTGSKAAVELKRKGENQLDGSLTSPAGGGVPLDVENRERRPSGS
jgi:hypothetical protein